MTKNILSLEARHPSGTTLIAPFSASVALLAGYVIFYQYAPLPGAWNNVVINTITALAAFLAALVATRIFRYYHPGDMPRMIWRNLMIAGWLWFAGEVFWGVINVMQGDVPVPSIADVPWAAGFIFFTAALYHQYLVIMPGRKKQIRLLTAGVWIIALLLPLIGLYIAKILTPGNYIDYFYPLADVAVGIAGLCLAMIFRGGAMMRPWIGLFIFGIADFSYAWAVQAGLYSWSINKGNLLSLVADSTYLAAYLILMLGFVGHWTLIKYGINPRTTGQ